MVEILKFFKDPHYHDPFFKNYSSYAAVRVVPHHFMVGPSRGRSVGPSPPATVVEKWPNEEGMLTGFKGLKMGLQVWALPMTNFAIGRHVTPRPRGRHVVTAACL